MENAAEALKMAGSVLLFVIALSVAILAFSTSRESLDRIIKYSDRESLAIANDSRFYYLNSDEDTQRYVGAETIIPTVYRAYKENFKVIFNFKESNYFLYKKLDQNSLAYNVNKIDLKNEALSDDLDSREFLNGLLYGADKTKYNSTTNYKSHFTFVYELPSQGLYYYISDWLSNGHKIVENLGTFYIEDLSEARVESNLQDDNNKNEKRVITYTFVSD